MIGRFVIALFLFVVGAPLVFLGGMASAAGGGVCYLGLCLWERANALMDLILETAE